MPVLAEHACDVRRTDRPVPQPCERSRSFGHLMFKGLREKWRSCGEELDREEAEIERRQNIKPIALIVDNDASEMNRLLQEGWFVKSIDKNDGKWLVVMDVIRPSYGGGCENF